jgi:hypothetical protein
MTTTEAYLQTWTEARKRYTNLLTEITEVDLRKKLANTQNSAGFLIRHLFDLTKIQISHVYLSHTYPAIRSF